MPRCEVQPQGTQRDDCQAGGHCHALVPCRLRACALAGCRLAGTGRGDRRLLLHHCLDGVQCCLGSHVGTTIASILAQPRLQLRIPEAVYLAMRCPRRPLRRLLVPVVFTAIGFHPSTPFCVTGASCSSMAFSILRTPRTM